MSYSKRRVERSDWYELLKYTPRIGQRAVDTALDAGKRFVSMFAFPRAGKSYGAGKTVGYKLLWPDHHIWIVAPKYELGSKEFIYIWQDLAVTGWLNAASVARSDVRSGNMVIEFPWGSFLRVVSADNPSSLRAEELDTVILAEASALSEGVFLHHLYARTEKRKGTVIVPTTPMGKNWVYDFFRIQSQQFDPLGDENPRYDPEFWSCVVSADPDMVDPKDWDLADIYEPEVHSLETVAKAKDRLPTPIFIEQFGGGFASYAGLVLPFDERKNSVAPFPIPDHWTHVVGWDHGSTSDGKTAIIVGSWDPRGHLYIWGEIHDHGKTAAVYYSWLRAIMGQEKSFSLVSVDPTAKQVRIELGALGLATTIPHDKQIMAGVIRLTELMREGKLHVLKGNCPYLEKEFWRMEWDEKNPKKIKDDHKFHCISALRYLSLVPVALPALDEEPNPIRPYSEIRLDREAQLLQRKLKHWKTWQEKMKREEEIQRHKEVDLELFEDPFEEDTKVVDDYDPYGGMDYV